MAIQSFAANLYCLARPPWKLFSHQGPFASERVVYSHNEGVLFLSVRAAVDGGIKMVKPALTTLLGCTAGNTSSNIRPILLTTLDKLCQAHVFFSSPGAFLQARFQHFGPALQALRVCATGNKSCYRLPVARVVLGDGSTEEYVVLRCPVLWLCFFLGALLLDSGP